MLVDQNPPENSFLPSAAWLILSYVMFRISERK